MATTPDPTVNAVRVLDRLMPGGRLQWTVFRALPARDASPLLLDTLSDGQQVDTSVTPVVTLLRNGTVLSAAAAAHWSQLRDPGTGLSTLAVDLQGLSLANVTAVSVTFQSVIDQTLVASAPLSRLVGQGDTLASSAVFLGDGAAPSTASVTLPTGTLAASVYAVNGLLVQGDAVAVVGDAVTYRLTLALPLSAAQNVQIVAAPPGLPGTMVFDGAGSSALPSAGHAQWGPLTTYTAARPSIAVSGGLTFTFGDILPLYGNGGTTVDLLFTTTLSGLPAGTQPLRLQAAETESNSFGATATSSASATLALLPPHLIVQTGTLYASGENSTFTGTGGPGYSPETGQFGAVVNSVELGAEPFNDTLSGVDAGDYVTFVIAVQNVTGQAAAYDVLLRDTMPAGFRIPDEGADISATDGAGYPISTTGNLFDPAGGLLLGAPLAGFDPVSGGNVALVTFTLQAASTVATPLAALQNGAQVVRYAARLGGEDVSATSPSQHLHASTPVTTAAPTLAVTQAGGGTRLLSGDLATYDVVLRLPEGETRDLRIDELLPRGAGARFELVSAQVVSVGANLTAALAPGAVAVDGHFSFGTVLNAADDQDTMADTITLQVVARGMATTGGPATLQTTVSAADPNAPGTRWSSTVESANVVANTNSAPTISGTWTAQQATATMQPHPFAGLVLQDVDAGQTETLTIRLSDPALGGFGTPATGNYNAATGTFVVTGNVAAVQQAARGLVFTPAAQASGTERFAITLNDGAGGVAQDSTTTIQISPVAMAATGFPHNAALPSATFLAAGSSGGATQLGGEVYQGPVSYLQSQFIYDGTDTVAIVAQTPNTFIKNIAANSAAIQLLSGQNVVDAGHGSNFLTGGSGADTFFLDGRTSGVTWDTIVGFGAGDMAVIWGFRPGTTSYAWVDNAGAPGYTGCTLHADLAGTGQITASLTFAGKTAADVSHYAVSPGSVGGNDYLAIIAL